MLSNPDQKISLCFRKEDEELRAIIEAQLANFESFKIIEETEEEEDEDEANEINDDPQALGSEISATTVEIVFGTTRTPDTTMMSAENQTEEGDYEEVVETTEPPEAESRVVEMDFLKKMAKQALQRKYKKVKKSKQLIEEK